MDYYASLFASKLNGGGGGSSIAVLEIYVADFIALQPIILDGSLNGYTRQIVS